MAGTLLTFVFFSFLASLIMLASTAYAFREDLSIAWKEIQAKKILDVSLDSGIQTIDIQETLTYSATESLQNKINDLPTKFVGLGRIDSQISNALTFTSISSQIFLPEVTNSIREIPSFHLPEKAFFSDRQNTLTRSKFTSMKMAVA